jgi:hypothetical protein
LSCHTSKVPALHAINLAQKSALIDQQWSPRVVAEMNDYQFKVVASKVNSSGTPTRKQMRPLL